MTRHSLLLLLSLTFSLVSSGPSTTPLLDVILSGAQSIYSDTFPSGSTNLGAFQSDAGSILSGLSPSTTAASSSASSTSKPSSSSTPSSTLATLTSSRASTTHSHSTTSPPAVSTSTTSKSSQNSLPGVDNSNQGLIYGLALGLPLGILALVLLAIALCLCRRRSHRRREDSRLIPIDSPVPPATSNHHGNAYPPMMPYSHGHQNTHLIPAPPPQMADSNSRSSRYYSASNSHAHSHSHDQEGQSLLTPSQPTLSSRHSHSPDHNPINTNADPSHLVEADSEDHRPTHPHHLSSTSTQPSSYSESLLGSPTSPAEMDGSSSLWASLPIPRRSSKRKRAAPAKKFHYPFSPTSEEVNPMDGPDNPEASGHQRGSSSFGRSGTGGSGKWFAGLGGSSPARKTSGANRDMSHATNQVSHGDRSAGPARKASSGIRPTEVIRGGQGYTQAPTSTHTAQEARVMEQRPRRISEIRRKPLPLAPGLGPSSGPAPASGQAYAPVQGR
ncbi:MAG: hypothetical protein M1828_006380 [Chrysothrix sp. TS-e1954]|nr:MAG: hypothetical protein M1828_006380 [Chrysothrix sp. TS-e1954]